jgi:predicted site-specific integrase-resolvase
MSETPEPAATERLMTCAEVAAIMRVTTRSVQNWAKQGILRAVKLPDRQRARGYLASEVKRLLTGKG